MVTPRLVVGGAVWMVMSLALGPDIVVMIGEFSCISRSERPRHRMTTWMLVDWFSFCFGRPLARDGFGAVSGAVLAWGFGVDAT